MSGGDRAPGEHVRTPLDRATLRRLVRARDLVHASHAEPLTPEALADAAGLSPTFFLRRFTADFGTTPHQYLTDVRLERARRELARGRAVTDVCFDVGFREALFRDDSNNFYCLTQRRG